MPLKKIILQVHLWLGMISGLIILFLGITGCLLSFQKEIESATQSYRYVKDENKQLLPPSILKNTATALLPAKHVHAVLYEGREKAAQVIFFAFEPVSYYYIIFLDPYTGKVLKVKNMDRDFFRQVLVGHYYLWLPPAIGQPIVASATLIFVVMIISGLILWWPKNKAAVKQRFSVKWSAKWRRRNYDLHNVLGFYMTWLAIIIAFTGLVWGFQWFAGSVYDVSGGTKNLVYSEPLSDTTKRVSTGAPAIDRVWEKMQAEHTAAQLLEVHIPDNAESPIAANANTDASTYWKTDYRYFDQYSLQELPASSIYGRIQDAGFADKLIRMNYDIHTGSILGISGKILMFFASLIAASLPVTGFYIWWGRRKKLKKETNIVLVASLVMR
jgi:uncharacterized iron-regulated membrane protein